MYILTALSYWYSTIRKRFIYWFSFFFLLLKLLFYFILFKPARSGVCSVRMFYSMSKTCWFTEWSSARQALSELVVFILLLMWPACDYRERERERGRQKVGLVMCSGSAEEGKKRFCCWSQIHFKGLWLFIICDSFLSTKSCTHKVLNFEVIVLMRSVTLLFSLQHNVTRLHSRAVNATHFNGCFVNLLYGELNICPLWRKNNKRARQKELAKL